MIKNRTTSESAFAKNNHFRCLIDASVYTYLSHNYGKLDFKIACVDAQSCINLPFIAVGLDPVSSHIHE